jgi:hypothetical protein
MIFGLLRSEYEAAQMPGVRETLFPLRDGYEIKN